MKQFDFIISCAFLLFEQVSITRQYNERLLKSLDKTVIYEGGQFGTVAFYSSVLLEDKTAEEFTSKHHGIVYKALQCKYAYLIDHLIRSLYEINVYGSEEYRKQTMPVMKRHFAKWLTTTATRLADLNPLVARVIDTLFDVLDESQDLKTTDQRFVKTLLATYSFLDYVKKHRPRVVDDNKTSAERNVSDRDADDARTLSFAEILNDPLVRVINLINLFRCANCGIKDPFVGDGIRGYMEKNRFTMDKLFGVLEPKLSDLNSLTDSLDGGFDSAHDDAAYDSKNLLFERLLRYNDGFLGSARTVIDRKKTELRTAFERLTNTRDIGDVLRYQTVLIEIVADLFRGRISALSSGPANATKHDLRALRSNYDAFVANMVPVNCPRGAFHTISKTKSLLDDALRDFDSDETVSQKLKALRAFVGPTVGKNVFYTNLDRNVKDDQNLSLLAASIAENRRDAVAFRRVMSVLSYESRLNGDFGVFKIEDGATRKVNDDDGRLTDRNVLDVRYALTSLMIVVSDGNGALFDSLYADRSSLSVGSDVSEPIVNDGDENTDFAVLFSRIVEYMVKKYKDFDDKKHVQHILSPLMIHFRRLTRRSTNMKPHDYQVLFQILFSTVSGTENYLLKNCEPTTVSMNELYENLKQNSIATIIDELHKFLKRSIGDVPKIGSFYTATLFAIYDVYCKSFLDGIDFEKKDKEIKLYWKGIPKYGHDVLNDLSQGIIDQYDLIIYQWFVMKWCLCKLLLEIKFVLKRFKEDHTLNPDKNKIRRSRAEINRRVSELKSIKFSESVQWLIDDTIKAVSNIVGNKHKLYSCTEFSEVDYEQGVRTIDDNLKTLGAFENKELNQDHVYCGINQYLFTLKKYLNKKQNTLILSDIIMSPIEGNQ